MKKLLAILLALTMLVPMLALAEDTAPEATLTTITFDDFQLNALLGDWVDDELNAAAKDLLDALTLAVYQSPDGRMVSYDVQLSGQSVLDLSLQQEDAQYYAGGSIIGGTVTFNMDEDLPQIAKLMYIAEQTERGKTMGVIEQALGENPDAAMITYRGRILLYSTGIVRLLQVGQVQPEMMMHIAEQGIDEAKMAEIITSAMPDAVREPVTNQPEGCDAAATVVSLKLTHDQLPQFACDVVEMLLDDPTFGNAAEAVLAQVRPILAMTSSSERIQEEGDTPLMAVCRQLLASVQDVQATAYLDAQDGLVKLTVQCQTLPETENETALPTNFSLVRNTTADGTQYQLTYAVENTQDTWTLSLHDGSASLDYVSGGHSLLVERHHQVQTSAVENGKHMLLTIQETLTYPARDEETPPRQSETLITLNYNDLLLDGEHCQTSEMTYARNGQNAVLLTVETRPCEVRPLLSESEGIYDLGDMSDAQYAAFNKLVTANAVLAASKVMSNLPASVLVLLNGTGTEGGAAE